MFSVFVKLNSISLDQNIRGIMNLKLKQVSGSVMKVLEQVMSGMKIVYETNFVKKKDKGFIA